MKMITKNSFKYLNSEMLLTRFLIESGIDENVKNELSDKKDSKKIPDIFNMYSFAFSLYLNKIIEKKILYTRPSIKISIVDSLGPIRKLFFSTDIETNIKEILRAFPYVFGEDLDFLVSQSLKMAEEIEAFNYKLADFFSLPKKTRTLRTSQLFEYHFSDHNKIFFSRMYQFSLSSWLHLDSSDQMWNQFFEFISFMATKQAISKNAQKAIDKEEFYWSVLFVISGPIKFENPTLDKAGDKVVSEGIITSVDSFFEVRPQDLAQLDLEMNDSYLLDLEYTSSPKMPIHVFLTRDQYRQTGQFLWISQSKISLSYLNDLPFAVHFNLEHLSEKILSILNLHEADHELDFKQVQLKRFDTCFLCVRSQKKQLSTIQNIFFKRFVISSPMIDLLVFDHLKTFHPLPPVNINRKGQAVVEYIMIMAVVVSLIMGLFKNLRGHFVGFGPCPSTLTQNSPLLCQIENKIKGGDGQNRFKYYQAF